MFGILSPMRLIELSNPNQPLLRRMLMETPGTYHHSMMVASLSEAACEAVGADGLLARVGAYYHD
ncbi:HDIG domain-containing metalloprotein, partial [Acinetobacter baumannii]|uniref:HDIG domain-containing metalloprotein n=2 Tax=Bacteria TaxID=2 RepID=UPI003F688DC5